MTNVITYQLAYDLDQTVELCYTHDNSSAYGPLGPVLHGCHRGTCDECTDRSALAAQDLDPCDLAELLALLNGSDPRCFDDYNDDCKSPSTDLPTFGGPGPDDTLGVWSWDATHQIVHDGADKFEIVKRDRVGAHISRSLKVEGAL